MPTLDEARDWYAHDDPVHGFDHVHRVWRLAEGMAAELEADQEIVRAAALLHDAAGARPLEGGMRHQHELASADFAEQVLAKEGWAQERIEAVQHAIRSHRYRSKEQPASLEAKILFDADKLDVLGAFGVVRTILYALQAGEPVFSEPSHSFLSSGNTEPGEPHSAYHEYLFKLRRVADRLHTEPARRIARERQGLMHAFFEQLAREARGGELPDSGLRLR